MLGQATVYATYEDDGLDGPGGQMGSYTDGWKRLLIFPNMDAAKEYQYALTMFYNQRKNPRITGFYSEDTDEILMSCHPARRM